MKPIVFSNNALQISITEVNKNKKYSCVGCSSYTAEHCNLKSRLSFEKKASELTATEIVVVVANLSGRQFSINTRNWEMVDSDGFSHGCFELCQDLLSPRMVAPNSWDITPGTQVKFALAFPELEEKVNAISLIYKGNPFIRMNIRKPTKKVEALLLAKEEYERKRSEGIKRSFTSQDI